MDPNKLPIGERFLENSKRQPKSEHEVVIAGAYINQTLTIYVYNFHCYIACIKGHNMSNRLDDDPTRGDFNAMNSDLERHFAISMIPYPYIWCRIGDSVIDALARDDTLAQGRAPASFFQQTATQAINVEERISTPILPSQYMATPQKLFFCLDSLPYTRTPYEGLTVWGALFAIGSDECELRLDSLPTPALAQTSELITVTIPRFSAATKVTLTLRCRAAQVGMGPSLYFTTDVPELRAMCPTMFNAEGYEKWVTLHSAHFSETQFLTTCIFGSRVASRADKNVAHLSPSSIINCRTPEFVPADTVVAVQVRTAFASLIDPSQPQKHAMVPLAARIRALSIDALPRIITRAGTTTLKVRGKTLMPGMYCFFGGSIMAPATIIDQNNADCTLTGEITEYVLTQAGGTGLVQLQLILPADPLRFAFVLVRERPMFYSLTPFFERTGIGTIEVAAAVADADANAVAVQSRIPAPTGSPFVEDRQERLSHPTSLIRRTSDALLTTDNEDDVSLCNPCDDEDVEDNRVPASHESRGGVETQAQGEGIVSLKWSSSAGAGLLSPTSAAKSEGTPSTTSSCFGRFLDSGSEGVISRSHLRSEWISFLVFVFGFLCARLPPQLTPAPAASSVIFVLLLPVLASADGLESFSHRGARASVAERKRVFVDATASVALRCY
ncbi:unnamed protein product [Amoebophrya sp. A25]|nr:unnamed protein product [Amoebophrya sp. A25]|eukprot:GSA25T00026549001.1